MAYSARQAPVVPPDKGSFPLDHEGACKEPMKILLACLQEHKNQTLPCRQLSLDYLQCRMNKGLMANESLPGLGFASPETLSTAAAASSATNSSIEATVKKKEQRGFIAGLEVKPVIPKKE